MQNPEVHRSKIDALETDAPGGAVFGFDPWGIE